MIFSGMDDGFIAQLRLLFRRRDPSGHNLVALEAGHPVSNPRRHGSSLTLNPTNPSHRV